MKNYKIRYTKPSGEQRVSTVAFDAPTAQEWKTMLEEDGNSGVEVFEVKPGE